MPFTFDHVVSEALTPVFALSGIGVFANGLSIRLNTISGRARDMHQKIMKTVNITEREIYMAQSLLFIKRAKLVRQAIFLLYAAIGCMVLTAILTGFNQIFSGLPEGLLTAITFLGGLILVFFAVLVEAWELTLSMTTLETDLRLTKLPYVKQD